MTNDLAEKMHVRIAILARSLLWLSGAAEALLLARLLARLLAARPDSPAFAALYLITGPLVAPLAALDHGRRQFGAILEFSTLAIAILMPVLAYMLWLWLATRRPGGSS
jgi:hypothetical protein